MSWNFLFIFVLFKIQIVLSAIGWQTDRHVPNSHNW